MTAGYIAALIALICTFILAFSLGPQSPVTLGMISLDTFCIWFLLFADREDGNDY